jgi:glutathione-regulated potassium-efflux system protein KefB
VAEQPLFVLGFAILLIAVKAAIITGIGLLAKMQWRAALALGLLLSQGGEFAFVLYTQAQTAMLIDAEAGSIFGAIVTLSMAATPFLMMATRRIRKQPAGPGEVREGPVNEGSSALIIGFGRFGQTVAQVLMGGGISVTLIDNDASRIDVAEEFGSKVYFGDGTRLDLLRQAGGGEVQLIMFCHDDVPEPQLIEAVHEAFPQALIYVRGYDRRSVLELAGGPAQFVMREVYESALRMALMGLEQVGASEAEMDRAETRYRDNDRARLQLQLPEGDLYAAQEMTRAQQRDLRGEG